MVHYCCAFNCKEKAVKGGAVTFHSFPNDAGRRKLWETQLKRENFTSTEHSKICSKHFKPECFNEVKFGGTWLKPDAVPTIFEFPTHLQKKCSTKQPPEHGTNHDAVSAGPSTDSSQDYFEEGDLTSPTKAKESLCLAQSKAPKYRKKVIKLKRNAQRQKKKRTTIKEVLQDIKQKKLISDTAAAALKFQSQSSTSFLSNASSIIGMQTVRPFEIIAANIQEPILQSQPLKVHAPSSVPASQNWIGEYGFTVSFSQKQRCPNGVTWTYSKITKKLYVKKDAPCPVNFSANTVLPDDVFIRATAFYSSTDHISKVVHRCINHSTDDLNEGLVEAEHLVRCECRNAQYQLHPLTHRHSVVTPFENPPVGQEFSTFIYKFTCFGSCPGGPNRRPMMIVFTLEKDNKVIGRHRIDVKICACPGRDQRYEECMLTECMPPQDDTVKERSSELLNLSDSMEFVRNVAFPVPKNVKILPSNEGTYTIKTDNLNCFEFLKQMKNFYEICKTMKGLPPDISSALISIQQQQIKKEDS